MSKDNTFTAPVPTTSLPPVLTSYDFLKATALLLMIIDHVGYFFYPDELWMRMIGRLSAPIWLFLVGYARSRDLSWRMWAGMGILVVSNYVVGLPMLPVNILGTMILCRLALDPLMAAIARNPKGLYPIACVLFFSAIFTLGFVEYGTAAMLMVMVGYITRNRENLAFSKNDVLQFAGIAGLLYSFMEIISFMHFTTQQSAFVAVGLLCLMLFLTKFRPYEYPALTEKIPGPIAVLIRLCGRRTLEIYVLHLLLFKAGAFYLGTLEMELFHFHIWK